MITSRPTPDSEDYLSNEMEEAHKLHVCYAGLVKFQVQLAEDVDVVDVRKQSCTYHKREVVGIPRQLGSQDFIFEGASDICQ